MSKFSAFWLRERETGNRLTLQYSNPLHKGLYAATVPCHSWGEEDDRRNSVHGGVFNLEFAPNGSILVATCEKNSILMFDPLRRKLIHSIPNAHRNCVISARFLDSCIFATGSDDNTIALWDVRNLNSQIRVLQGHRNSVQNIEYSAHDGLLVTSGFDGSICTWDINSFAGDLGRNVVFATHDLMRMKLTPDASKMIISTTRGYLMVVHDVDFRTLAADLEGFHPDVYRLLMARQSVTPWVANFSRLFSPTRRRNRLELITDFPNGGEAKVISSLEVHPRGRCVLSRSVAEKKGSEWTCTHALRSPPRGGEGEARRRGAAAGAWRATAGRARLEAALAGAGPRAGGLAQEVRRARAGLRSAGAGMRIHLSSAGAARGAGGEGLAPSARLSALPLPVAVPGPAAAARAGQAHGSGWRDWRGPLGLPGDRRMLWMASGPHVAPSFRNSDVSALIRRRLLENTNANPPIFQRTPRLTHFIEEPNAGKWYIKELSFSPDGRVMCSPFSCGVRLLAFSHDCSELDDTPAGSPAPMYELGTNMCHLGIVLATRFSPHHCQLVTGCIGGNVVWHQPVL